MLKRLSWSRPIGRYLPHYDGHNSSASIHNRLACYSRPRRCLFTRPSTRPGVSPSRTRPRPVRVLCSPRTLFTESIPPILYPPCIFVGLLLGLWTWKCFWIVIMQNKLLYLSWLPPFSRSDTVAEYEAQCKPVRWEEKQIRSLDGTKLAICEGHIPCDKHESSAQARQPLNKVVVCYFQGNGGSTPLRLPLLSQVLKGLSAEAPAETEFKVVALSYRGYWKSSGRATQSGIQRDAQAFLNWASDTYSSEEESTHLQLILWGHSLGSAVATFAIPAYLSSRENAQSSGSRVPAQISGVVMEAPTSSIKDMLISLYPQRWLPYRYLWPFSWNTWCNASNLIQIVDWREEHPLAMSRIPPILILSAENDEVIPPYVAGQLEQKGLDLGLDVFRKEVRGAMHTEAPMKEDGRKALIQFICDRTSTTG